MDKRTATLTLTEKLGNLGYINLVVDPAVKSYLLNNAKSVILALKKGRIRTVPLGELYYSKFEKTPVTRRSIPSELGDFPEANYFFAEGGKLADYGNYLKNPFVTPVALVGEAEERVLREHFYKSVPDDVAKAFDVLNLSHFIHDYTFYSSWTGGEPWQLYLKKSYRPFRKDEKVELGDVVRGTNSGNYYLVDEIQADKKGVKGYKGDTFINKDLTSRAGTERKDCNYDNAIPAKKGIVNTEFFKFVFSLPSDDQNIVANKLLLKEVGSVDACDVMLKEYSKDNLFKDYFAVLGEKCQKEVVRSIKALPKRNKFLDSWLFKEGFDIDVDYLKLYKEDTEGFIRYFEYNSTEVRKLIISDLLGYEHVNPEVIEFLEKKYSHLLRDTAFNDK